MRLWFFLLFSVSVLSSAAQDFIPFFGDGSSGDGLLNNLVAYWKFEETTGNALDSSGNGRTLTANDNPATTAGIVLNARQYVKTGTDFFWRTNDAAFAFTNSAMTITAWAQFNQQVPDTDDMTVISRGDWIGNTNFSWWIFLDNGAPDDLIYFVWSTDGTFNLANSVAYTISGGVNAAYFYFIAVRWNGTTLHISVTESQETSVASDQTGAFSGPFFENGTTALTFGDENGVQPGIHQMDGIIDEAGIWSRYLSDCQLGWLFTARNGVFTYGSFDAALSCDGAFGSSPEWDVTANKQTFDVTASALVYSIH